MCAAGCRGENGSDPQTFEVVGREAELEAIGAFLGDPASRALVLEGEAGIGKTTLWLAAAQRGSARCERRWSK